MTNTFMFYFSFLKDVVLFKSSFSFSLVQNFGYIQTEKYFFKIENCKLKNIEMVRLMVLSKNRGLSIERNVFSNNF